MSQPFPLKRISSRDSGTGWNWTIRFGSWFEGSLESFAEGMTRFSKSLLLQYDDPMNFEHPDGFSSSTSLFGV
jgi:hypothetical protein